MKELDPEIQEALNEFSKTAGSKTPTKNRFAESNTQLEAKSQLDAVRKHLIGFGHITEKDARNEYGVTRLSHLIWLLREEGLPIETLRKQVVSKYGNKGSQAIYNLMED